VELESKKLVIARYLADTAVPLKASKDLGARQRFCALESLCLAIQEQCVKENRFETNDTVDRFLRTVSTRGWATGEIAELVGQLRADDPPPWGEPQRRS